MKKNAYYPLIALLLLLFITIFLAIGSMKTSTIPPSIVKNITLNGSDDLPLLPEVAVNPNGAYVYVTNDRFATVSVISTHNNTVVATIRVGIPNVTFPEGIVVAPDGNYMYVADSGSNTISVISTVNNTLVSNISIRNTSVNGNPWWLAITPDGKYLYASSHVISIVSTSNNTVVGSLEVNDSGLSKIAFSPDSKYAYAAICCSHNNSILKIATRNNTIVGRIAVNGQPFGVALTPDGRYLYVTNIYTDNVTIISTYENAAIGSINVGALQFGISGIPNGAYVYVADRKGISVIDTTNNSVAYMVNNVGSPEGVAATPDGKYVYVSYDSVSNTSFTPVVSVLSTPTKVTSTIPPLYIITIMILVMLIAALYLIGLRARTA